MTIDEAAPHVPAAATAWTPDTPPLTKADFRAAVAQAVRVQELRDAEHCADMSLVFDRLFPRREDA